MTRSLRFSILFLAACGLLLSSPGWTFAEEEAGDFPPPDSTPSEAPPKKAPPAKKAAWSPPAVTPGAGSDLGSLPPPRVIRRRGSMPARAATPNRSTAPRRSTTPSRSAGTAAPIRDVPAVRTAPIGRVPVRPAPPRNLPPTRGTARSPTTRTPTARTPTPAAIPSNRLGQAGIGGSRVFGIAKKHNVPLKRVPGEAQELALQFDVDYEVSGQAGRDVHVAMWFTRVDNNTLVTSSMPAYGDARGKATLQTRSARIGPGANARYKASLLIPYRAFPIGEGESSYDVEARVQILRTEPDGRVTVLCSGTTTFRVYGFDEGDAAPAKAEDREGKAPSTGTGAGEKGPAIANEDGTITDSR